MSYALPKSAGQSPIVTPILPWGASFNTSAQYLDDDELEDAVGNRPGVRELNELLRNAHSYYPPQSGGRTTPVERSAPLMVYLEPYSKIFLSVSKDPFSFRENYNSYY